MKILNLFFLCFLFLRVSLFSEMTSSQITGQVVDSKTGEPLVMANVFLSMTTLGAASDKKGQFVINNVPNGSYTLVASYIGYQFKKIQIQLFEPKMLTYHIKLDQKPIEMGNVEVVAKKEKNLMIQYFPIYKEMKSENLSEINDWAEQRKKTYAGSCRHLLSAIVRDRVRDEGFELYQSNIMTDSFREEDLLFNSQELITPFTNRLKECRFSGYLGVGYRKIFKSWIKLSNDYILIDSLGIAYNDPSGIRWAGYWGSIGIADGLPLDYRIDDK